MTLLRAQASHSADWWEIQLLDLDVAADGSTEAEMLSQLEFALCAEYHIAVSEGRTPYVNLLTEAARERDQVWVENGKIYRALHLPENVRIALTAALRGPSFRELNVELGQAA